MIYYRVALKTQQSSEWKWRSTVITSLSNLLMFLHTNHTLIRERALVFCSLSADNMDELLRRENAGKVSSAMPASHFIKGLNINAKEIAKFEMELNVTDDYDIPYVFTGPSTVKQALAWSHLMARVQAGELKP